VVIELVVIGVVVMLEVVLVIVVVGTFVDVVAPIVLFNRILGLK
jgi:hypothetical protein